MTRFISGLLMTAALALPVSAAMAAAPFRPEGPVAPREEVERAAPSQGPQAAEQRDGRNDRAAARNERATRMDAPEATNQRAEVRNDRAGVRADRTEVSADRTEVRADRTEVRADRMQVGSGLAERRGDRRDGRADEARADNRELRSNGRDLRRDGRDFQNDRRDVRDERRDGRNQQFDARDNRNDRYDARDNRNDRFDRGGRDWRADNRRWDERRWGGFDNRGWRYGYATPRWNGLWTPWGFGYGDSFALTWGLRWFDYDHDGRLRDYEWSRAQQAFYRFADRNGDGYVSQWEYDWAIDAIRYDRGYRW